MEVKRLTLEEWNEIGASAHLACFGEVRLKEMNTFDFALLVVKDDIPQCYCTVIETDKDSCYMQHGGRFPSSEGTTAVWRSYSTMVDWISERYPVIVTKTKMENVPMLKIALKAGFVPNGFDIFGEEKFIRLLKSREIN